MKEVYRNDDVIAYDGFRDVFGNKMYVVINTTLQELRLYSLYKDYKAKRKALDKNKLPHVCIPEYGIVIDVTKKTANEIEKTFAGYKHTEWQIVN